METRKQLIKILEINSLVTKDKRYWLDIIINDDKYFGYGIKFKLLQIGIYIISPKIKSNNFALYKTLQIK